MKKIKPIIIATILSAVIGTESASAQAKQSYLFLRGVESALLGNDKASEALLKETLKVNPTHAPSLWYLSELSAKQNDMPQAVAYSKEAYTLDTTNTQYTERYARLLISNNQVAEALPLFEKLAEKEPKNKEYHIIVASILTQSKNMPRAREVATKYEELFGLDEAIIETIYNGYIISKEYFMALTYMEDIVKVRPDDIAYSLTLADIKAALNFTNQAENIYQETLAKNPNSLQAQISLANFYKLNNKTSDYIKALKAPFENLEMNKQAKIDIFTENFFTPDIYRFNYYQIQALAYSLIVTYPSDLDICLLYGRYLTYIGETDNALQQYELIQSKGFSSSELLERLMEIYLYKEQYDKSLETALKGQETYGGYPFINGEIVAQWQKKNYKEATSLASKAVKRVESDSLKSQIYGLQGDIYHEMGKHSQCYAAYRKGLKYNPDNALILNNYGYFMGERGKRLKDALEMTTRANELSPDNATYLDSQAWVLYMMGEYVEAQLIMSRVMELDPQPSGEVLMHYGDILYALGDDFLARNYWKKALEAGAPSKEIEKRVLQKKAVKKSYE